MSDLKMIEELFDKHSDFVCTSNDGERLIDKNGFDKAIMEFREANLKTTQEPTMYEVTFQSDNTEDIVLSLSFIPKKGNVFEFVKPLIPIHEHNYFLKVKSVGFDIDKEGKISKIKAWCRAY